MTGLVRIRVNEMDALRTAILINADKKAKTCGINTSAQIKFADGYDGFFDSIPYRNANRVIRNKKLYVEFVVDLRDLSRWVAMAERYIDEDSIKQANRSAKGGAVIPVDVHDTIRSLKAACE